MSMKYGQDFTLKLAEALSAQLPGWEIQRKMSASHRGNTDFSFNFDNPPVESSVLLMLFELDGVFYFPLIQRPLYQGVHSGQIGLPGGKTEPEDENREITALREAEEEIGIDAGKVKVIGQLSPLYVPASNYEVYPFVGVYPEAPDYKPDPAEVSGVIDCEVHELVGNETTKVTELLIHNKYLVKAPYYDVKGHVVWGATAMILCEFIEIVKAITR